MSGFSDRDAVIVGAVRTPVGKGKANGALHGVLPADLLALAFDPQTSGGLLATVKPSLVDAVLASLASRGVDAVAVGQVAPASGTTRLFLR